MDTESRTVTNQTVEDSRNEIEAPIKEIYCKLIFQGYSLICNIEIFKKYNIDIHTSRTYVKKPGFYAFIVADKSSFLLHAINEETRFLGFHA